MPELDIMELARSLEKTSANIDRLIKVRGQEVGAALGKTYAKAADDRIKENAAKMQRLEDLVAELRQQMAPLEQQSDRLREVRNALVAASRDGEAVIDIKALLDVANGTSPSRGGAATSVLEAST